MAERDLLERYSLVLQRPSVSTYHPISALPGSKEVIARAIIEEARANSAGSEFAEKYRDVLKQSYMFLAHFLSDAVHAELEEEAAVLKAASAREIPITEVAERLAAFEHLTEVKNAAHAEFERRFAEFDELVTA